MIAGNRAIRAFDTGSISTG